MVISKIIWDIDKIIMISKNINAVKHKHTMLQFFLGLEDCVNITVNGQAIKSRAVLVGRDVRHAVDNNAKLSLSMLIDPTSDMGDQLNKRLNGCNYLVMNAGTATDLITSVYSALEEFDKVHSQKVCEKVNEIMGIRTNARIVDPRVLEILAGHMLDEVGLISLNKLSDTLFISQSRLSHLFKEQTGITLQGYLIQKRLQLAFESLLRGNSITKASLDAGFDTPSHFAATVKRMLGMSAREAIKYSEFVKVN